MPDKHLPEPAVSEWELFHNDQRKSWYKRSPLLVMVIGLVVDLTET
jgi:hypothetical protein